MDIHLLDNDDAEDEPCWFKLRKTLMRNWKRGSNDWGSKGMDAQELGFVGCAGRVVCYQVSEARAHYAVYLTNGSVVYRTSHLCTRTDGSTL